MKFIGNIWLRAVPVLRLWILLTFSPLAPLPMLGYDGHDQANIAYDGSKVERYQLPRDAAERARNVGTNLRALLPYLP